MMSHTTTTMTSHRMRTYALNKLSTLLKIQESDKLCMNLEKCIFNWAVRTTRLKGDQPSWENAMFKNRYRTKFLSLQFNMKDPNNFLVDRLKSGEINVTDVTYLHPWELNPYGLYAVTKQKLHMEHLHKEAVNDTGDNYEGIFKCGKCKSKKTTYYQMQTRSADEPMTTFVTCVNCNNRWKC
jgi:transcription elongation factor S-II